jgi:hypothetical protein
VKTRRALPGSLAKVDKNPEKQVERPKFFGGSAKSSFEELEERKRGRGTGWKHGA